MELPALGSVWNIGQVDDEGHYFDFVKLFWVVERVGYLRHLLEMLRHVRGKHNVYNERAEFLNDEDVREVYAGNTYLKLIPRKFSDDVASFVFLEHFEAGSDVMIFENWAIIVQNGQGRPKIEFMFADDWECKSELSTIWNRLFQNEIIKSPDFERPYNICMNNFDTVTVWRSI
jgi:hypothetical protein